MGKVAAKSKKGAPANGNAGRKKPALRAAKNEESRQPRSTIADILDMPIE